MMKYNSYTVSVLVLLITTLGLIGCNKEENPSADLAEIPKNVRVLPVRSSDLEEYFEISGPVVPVQGTDLCAQESGPVVSLPLKKGEAVSENTIVIEQDRTILQADMESAQTALETQEYNLDKVQLLFNANKVSKIELLNARSAYAQSKGMADISKLRYQRAATKAPFAGILADRYVELGQLVMPGQKLVRVIDPYTLKVQTHLTDQQVNWVKNGDSAHVLMGGNPEPISAEVTWISLEADRMTGKFKVELEIDNPDLKFHSGVIGRARLKKHSSKSVIVVPRDAIVSGRAGPAVYVVEDSRARLRQLSLGTDQGLMVVINNGLAVGDKVVVRGQRDLREGNLVSIIETSPNIDGSLDSDVKEVKESGSSSRVTASGSGFGQ